MLLPLRSKEKLYYGWVMVGTFFIAGIVIWGLRFSYGIFFKSIEGEFGLSRAATSSIFSVHMVLGGAFAILGGWALDRYGPRLIVFLMGLSAGISLLLTSQTTSLWQLFMTYSLLLAMGTSPMFTVTMSTVSRWFDKKRGAALGIAGSGAGLGMLALAPLATFLISRFDWRTAYLVIGLITLAIVLPLSRLLKRNPPGEAATDGAKARPEEKSRPADLPLSRVFRTRSFWLFMFIWFFFAIGVFLVLTHIVPHATDMGLTPAQAAMVLSIIGGTNVAGRVLLGIASDKIGWKLNSVTCALVQAGALIWLNWIYDAQTFYLFAVIYGVAYGGLGPSVAALIGDSFGLRRMGSILGVLDVGFGAGAAVGPLAGGLIFDASNSYSAAFFLGAGAMLATALLIALVKQETHNKLPSETSL